MDVTPERLTLQAGGDETSAWFVPTLARAAVIGVRVHGVRDRAFVPTTFVCVLQCFEGQLCDSHKKVAVFFLISPPRDMFECTSKKVSGCPATYFSFFCLEFLAPMMCYLALAAAVLYLLTVLCCDVSFFRDGVDKLT